MYRCADEGLLSPSSCIIKIKRQVRPEAEAGETRGASQ